MHITEPFAKQEVLLKHALDKETRVIVYGGGIRGGKSFSSFLALFLLLLKKYPGSKAAVVRESLPTLKRNTIPVFKKIVPSYRIKSYDQTMQIVTFDNDSQLIFFPENYYQDKELERWKGLEVNFFLLEEFPELQEVSFYKAIERAGAWIVPSGEQPPPKIICTCNPSRGCVKELIYDPYVKGKLNHKWVYIPALITDNPYIPEDYRENLKNLPERQYKTFVQGDWDSLELENVFLEQFNEAKNIKPVTYDVLEDVHLCWDFNIASTCLAIQYVNGEIRVLKEYHQTGGLEGMCFAIKSDFPTAFFYINGDASGASGSAFTANNDSGYNILKELLDLGYEQFRVPAANPTHKSSYYLSNLVFKHVKVYIDPSCLGLKKDILNVQVIRKGNKIEIDKSDESLTHFLDPLRYYIHAEHYDIAKELNLEDFINQ